MIDLVLELQGALHPDVLHGITSSIASTPGCLVTRAPLQGPKVLMKVSVDPLRTPGAAAALPTQAHNAEAVLQATAWLEHNVHATPGLVALLHQQGITSNAQPLTKPPPAAIGSVGASNAGRSQPPAPESALDIHSSSHSSLGSNMQLASRAANRVGTVEPVASSPAGPAVSPDGGGGGGGELVGPGTATAAASRSSGGTGEMQGTQGAQQEQQQPLMPLLQRCGVLGPVYPEHDAAAVGRLRSQVWRHPLAPVTEFRQYFGDQIGFYLAYLNALACWLLAPAAASGLFLWTLGGTGLDSKGLNHPMIPILVVFQLLWSAAGVKLWRRHQALLHTQWYRPPSQGLGSNSMVRGPDTRLAGSVANASTNSYDSHSGTSLSASRQASLSYSHLRGGVPQWAVEAPTATGTRWQFAGAWRRNVKGQWQLQAPLVPQLFRIAASVAATAALLLLAASVLVACLNVQGLIAPMHGVLQMPLLAALSSPGGLLSSGVLAQVPTVLRVLAVSLYDAYAFGPAARALTGFENRRTLEGFDASLTAKKAALQFIFVFAPVAYVGLAGAGAASAANDAAAYFKLELLRRIAMEFVMPWVSSLLARRQQKAKQRAAAQNVSQPGSIAGQQALLVKQEVSGATTAVATAVPAAAVAAGSSSDDDALKPQFDPFTGVWDVTRDMGYVMLFASILPWAAPLTLIYTLAKIKQDCMSLLLVYQRPMPRTMRNLGSWNTVLLVQIFMAVVTNVFLSGLSSGQVAQLLPQVLVPKSVTHSITAAAASRPSDSSAAGQSGALTASGWPSSPLDTLQALDAGSLYMQGLASSVGQYHWNTYTPGSVCPVLGLVDSIAYSKMCPAGHQVLGSPVFRAATAPYAASEAGLGFSGGSGAASTHLLLLFALEHLLVLLVVLVFTLVPDDPAGRKAGRAPTQLAAAAADLGAGVQQQQQQQLSAQCMAPAGVQMHMQTVQPESFPAGSKVLGVHVVRATDQPLAGSVSSASGLQAGMQVEMPVQLHGNPLFTANTARKSNVV